MKNDKQYLVTEKDLMDFGVTIIIEQTKPLLDALAIDKLINNFLKSKQAVNFLKSKQLIKKLDKDELQDIFINYAKEAGTGATGQNVLFLDSEAFNKAITKICSLIVSKEQIIERLNKIFEIDGDNLCDFQLVYEEELSQEEWTAKEAKKQMLTDIANVVLEGK